MIDKAEDGLFERKRNRSNKANNLHMTINVRIFMVIVTVAIMINVSGLAVGVVFLTRSIRSAMEADMLVAVDIADKYVTKEIELLKVRAFDAALEFDSAYRLGESAGVLERIRAKYPEYIGLYAFDGTALIDSWGKPCPPDLNYAPFFMRTADYLEGTVSTTMHCPDGELVMYISVPMIGKHILVVALPGLHFSELVSQLTFWQSGHLFISDADGYVISNYYAEWVRQRANFIEMAESDSSYESAAVMVRRGIAGERGTDQFIVGGVSRLCAFRPVSSPNEGWFVGIVAPLSESALKDIPSSILLMGMIMLILSIVAANVAALVLKRPYEEVDHLRKEAEAVSISKSTFLATMSHEIRTPMNSILGFSELAMDGEASIKTKDYLGQIKINAHWLLNIINDVLDISKVESGRMELENIPFDMHDLFASCRTLIMPKAAEKGITLYFYVEPSIGKKPLGDPTRLRQVLVNLLSNAVKFTNTGMVKLNSVIKDVSENTTTVYFEVKDSGIGMSTEQIQRVFEPFIQAETGTTRKFGGTGLGLSITKNIVELMGGTLSVESNPGIGSKFSFELTFDTIDVTNEELLEKKIIFNDLERPEFEGEILLCEDNSMNQQVICEHLARVGLTTVVAVNGKIGVEMVQDRIQKGEKQFDLIFMDMHMPVMDGLEAAGKIFELNTGVPIVAMTANVMSNDRDIYRTSGMSDCVGKPFTSQELWHCLMKYFTPVGQKSMKKIMQLEADMEFQRSLQRLFVRNNQHKYQEIITALEKGDIKTAHRLVHTLKSNAGQLGRILLQQVAADVEQGLKEGNNMVSSDQLTVLETELSIVLHEFSSLIEALPADPEMEAPPELGHEQIVELFADLEPLLKGGNPECLNLVKRLRSVPYSRKLIQQMDDFDFEAAVVTLAELKKELLVKP